MTSKKEKYLGKKAAEWLQSKEDESPPEGWRDVEWIRINIKKGAITRCTCKIHLDMLVRQKELLPPRKYKIGAHYKMFYYVGV